MTTVCLTANIAAVFAAARVVSVGRYANGRYGSGFDVAVYTRCSRVDAMETVCFAAGVARGTDTRAFAAIPTVVT